MTDSRSAQLFSVGDTVRLKSNPYPNPHEDCPFGWNPLMDEYCGKSATIVGVRWYPAEVGKYGYSLDIDNEEFVWADECFEDPDGSNIDESDCDLSVLFA